ncbi:ArfGap-domain-containing protein [Dendrothele bispora CBS 962.96]|uniref:ArfGap-domain-containing protein n=1 Tax=Dendrothele bispora (strain CBS 962.96) TaxID=1314807 RepID=A0A4S8MIY4_DENBC|nr:ArfGap-domain-containing protein [Dendrothele bispora CBS 962.96]
MTSKLVTEKNQKILLELAIKPGNDICADCKARNPRWASHNLGIFICVNCATIHRKIGTHITKVKSLTLDSWTKEQVEKMKEMGNVKSNAIYNPNEVRNPPPPMLTEDERDSELEQYIREISAKYEYKRFFDRSALVASKLGPSRSAASIASRPRSTPADADQPTVSSSTSASASLSTAGTTRPSTTAPTSVSTTQSRSVSQPISNLPAGPSSQPAPASAFQQQQQYIQPQARQQSLPVQNPTSGVWSDLVSLQAPAANSSLPLQYSSPTQSFAPSNPFNALSNPGFTGAPNFASSPSAPTTNGMSGMNGMSTMVGMNSNPTGFGAGLNPTNPFSQMQSQSTNPFSQMMPQRHQTMPAFSSPFGSMPNASGIASTPFGQNPTLPQSPAPMFSPQPQQVGMQGQQGQGQMQSFMSHSPGIPMSTTPQMHMTPSPFGTSPGTAMGIGMTSSPGPPMGIGGMSTGMSPGMNAGVMGMSGMTNMNGFGGQPQQRQFGGTGPTGWMQQQQPGMFSTQGQETWDFGPYTLLPDL